jgi:hypothetical protein
MLGCRFVEKLFRPYWQLCSNLQEDFEFSEVANSEQEEAINRFLLAPLDQFREPQVKVGLFRSDLDTLYKDDAYCCRRWGFNAVPAVKSFLDVLVKELPGQ